jgi:hypothetical protein
MRPLVSKPNRMCVRFRPRALVRVTVKDRFGCELSARKSIAHAMRAYVVIAMTALGLVALWAVLTPFVA